LADQQAQTGSRWSTNWALYCLWHSLVDYNGPATFHRSVKEGPLCMMDTCISARPTTAILKTVTTDGCVQQNHRGLLDSRSHQQQERANNCSTICQMLLFWAGFLKCAHTLGQCQAHLLRGNCATQHSLTTAAIRTKHGTAAISFI